MNADLLPTADIQNWLQGRKFLPDTPGTIDGIPGPLFDAATKAAVARLAHDWQLPDSALSWSADRRRTVIEQHILALATSTDVGPLDGLIGPRTLYALEIYQNISRDRQLTPAIANLSNPTSPFPRQRDIRSWLGEPGTADCRQLLSVPFPLRMDGSLSATAPLSFGNPKAPKPITRIALHKKLHASASQILSQILSHYTLAGIQSLGLDQYAGSYNYRPMRGGTALSMHSWGAAIDFDAQRNGLRETAATARFATKPYIPFVEAFYDHGWISLGKERNFDWMHFQAPRL